VTADELRTLDRTSILVLNSVAWDLFLKIAWAVRP